MLGWGACACAQSGSACHVPWGSCAPSVLVETPQARTKGEKARGISGGWEDDLHALVAQDPLCPQFPTLLGQLPQRHALQQGAMDTFSQQHMRLRR